MLKGAPVVLKKRIRRAKNDFGWHIKVMMRTT